MFSKANLLALAVLVAALPGGAASDNADRKLQEWTGGVEYATPPDDLPAGWNTIVSNDDYCRKSDCCKQCEGRCYDDKDCHGTDSPLKCFRREFDGPVEGCIGSPKHVWGYCYHPTGGYVEPDSTLDPRHIITRATPCSEADLCLRKCEGECTDDLQCAVGHACYIKGEEAVTDCHEWTGSKGVGYCGGGREPEWPSDTPTTSPAPTFTEQPSWKNREIYGRNILLVECPAEGCPVCSGEIHSRG